MKILLQNRTEAVVAPESPTPKAFLYERIPGKDERLTLPEIIGALGDFDLDPCAPVDRGCDTAKQRYTIHDSGLLKPWFGRVWLNPPCGDETVDWLERLAEHGNGIALLYARTETRTFFRCVWEVADAVLFLKGPLTFCDGDGALPRSIGGVPFCLIAYGKENEFALRTSRLPGRVIIP